MSRKISALAVLILSFCFVLAACSSNSDSDTGHTPVRPLSADETARMSAALGGVAEVTNLGSALDQAHVQQSTPRAHASIVPGSKLKALIDQSNCTKSMKFPEDQPPLKVGNSAIARFAYDISGAECPLRYHAEIEGQQHVDAQGQPNGLKAVLSVSYQALSQAALDASDTDALNLRAEIAGNADVTPNGTQSMKFTMSMTGDGHSQREGAFRASDSIDASIDVAMEEAQPGMPAQLNGTVTETMLFTFKDMASELTSKVVMTGTQEQGEFYINGQRATAEEYATYRKALNIPGLSNKNNQAPNPVGQRSGMSVLACESRVYNRADIEPATLQTDIDANMEPAVLPRSHFETCSEMAPSQFFFPDGDFTYFYQFDFENPAYAQATVDVCSAKDVTKCAHVRRAFLANEKRGFADAAGKYTVMIRCEPKPACM